MGPQKLSSSLALRGFLYFSWDLKMTTFSSRCLSAFCFWIYVLFFSVIRIQYIFLLVALTTIKWETMRMGLEVSSVSLPWHGP